MRKPTVNIDVADFVERQRTERSAAGLPPAIVDAGARNASLPPSSVGVSAMRRFPDTKRPPRRAVRSKRLAGRTQRTPTVVAERESPTAQR